jgi:trehalose 6-phosphate synthase
LLVGITLISAVSTYFNVLAHKHALRLELERRTQWFAAGLEPQIEQLLSTGKPLDWPATLTRLRQQPDQPGLAIFNQEELLLASDGQAPPAIDPSRNPVHKTLVSGKETVSFVRVAETGSDASSDSATHPWLEDAVPLNAGGHTVGVLVMMADAGYIRSEAMDVWRRSFLPIVAMVVVIVVVTLLMVHWFVDQPMSRAAEWLRRLRHGQADIEEGSAEFGYLVPIAREVNSLADSLTQARAEAENEAWLRNRGEDVWTAQRLAVNARQRLGTGRLFVISNREPYMHLRRGGKTECVVPPSGLVTALEPVLRACDGTWIAHGSGSEDKAFVDENDRLRVPPSEERYTLRRVWLSEEEEAGYYEGFSNEGLWPLCHIAHTRPIFRSGDWTHYQDVNRKFADALLQEMQSVERPVVLVQDYHFSLLPRMVKRERPDARVAMFWHIPWPNPEAFGICPWGSLLLDGLLGADVIGFHLQSHCNNFLATVDRVLEAQTDWEHFSIRRNDHVSSVRPYPISVAWDEADSSPRMESSQPARAANGELKIQVAVSSILEMEAAESRRRDAAADVLALHRELGIEGKRLLLGVDRLDYTKGIVERLLAVEHLFEVCPWYLEQIVFVQVASPSRTRIPSYVQLRVQVEEAVERINRRYQSLRWSPVILIERNLDHDEVKRYYRAADLCLVTSLHDGMNLVAKEYVAARSDCDGMLILSKFAGAAQELRDALLVNPYDVEQVSLAIRTGLEMSREDRRLRMERMRHFVKEHNVYRWASNILTDLCAVRIEDQAQPVSISGRLRKLA